ncbi:Xanthine dehydrogenase [Carbonactinospora thermoautotrophica]|uniref:Xanthine dehydrogenase n=2 Tax=Carbonactinospora thermoautotrophica TaxID=1469144 RepID=A0A132MWG7_9ACTN|nr:Xanthine dehydrogenase [Carbonactinospora thermoautotrophica]
MNLASMPRSLDEAVEALSATPGALAIAGGTDLMVEINAGLLLPRAVVALADVPELAGWTVHEGHLLLGANLTFAQLSHPDLAVLAPALAQAARAVGSPQVRNVGTLGGNIGTAAPTSDLLPALTALGAVVTCRGPRGWREVPLGELLAGRRRPALLPGELVVSVRVPLTRGPQEFIKVGRRNALAPTVASFALVIDLDHRYIGCAAGAVAPAPVRLTEAEQWLATAIDWVVGRVADPGVYDRFGELVARQLDPVDDYRAPAAYRRHVIAVCAARALRRALPTR